MTKRLLTLTLLQAAGDRGVTTAELLQSGVGSRYGARICELREQGYDIETTRVREGSHRYTLLAPAAPHPPGDPGPEAAALFDHVGGLTRQAIYGEGT